MSNITLASNFGRRNYPTEIFYHTIPCRIERRIRWNYPFTLKS